METPPGGTRVGEWGPIEPVDGLARCGRLLTKISAAVAVKFVHASLLALGDTRERFQREARAVAQLLHTGIVSVHEVTEREQGT